MTAQADAEMVRATLAQMRQERSGSTVSVVSSVDPFCLLQVYF
jgi:hypothetical protein